MFIFCKTVSSNNQETQTEDVKEAEESSKTKKYKKKRKQTDTVGNQTELELMEVSEVKSYFHEVTFRSLIIGVIIT